jgi:muramoyltetrapeptide carboxypeptidase
MAMTDFSGKYGLSPFASRYFWGLLEAGAAGAEAAPEDFLEWGTGAKEKAKALQTLVAGQAEGTLTGGNLSTIAALLGTPYEIDTGGKILFIEEVNEEPFRIDRMLCQLKLAGKLAGVRGVLLGAFVRCEAAAGSASFTVEEVLKQYFSALEVPVLAGYPSGHLPEQPTLPLGSRVRLDATAGRLTLLESPVEPSPARGD